MQSAPRSWKKPIAVALAFGVLAQPVHSGLSLATSAPTTERPAALTALDTTPPALPKPLTLPAQPITAATSVGYLPASWDVTPTGQFTYTIPLDVPPGRAGIQPALSLQYSSGSGNGLVGVGWSLAGFSSITYCGKSVASDGVAAGIHYGPAGAFAQKHTVLHNVLSDNRLHGQRTAREITDFLAYGLF